MHEQRRPRHHAARRGVAPRAAPLHRGMRLSQVSETRLRKTARTHDHVRTERYLLRVFMGRSR